MSDALDNIDPTLADQAVERSPTAIVVLDGELGIRFANRHAHEAFGAEPGVLVGRSGLDFVRPDDVQFTSDLVGDGVGFDEALLGPVTIRLRRVDGTEFTAEFWARCLTDDSGWVISGNELSTSSHLSEVASSVASGDAIDETMSHVVEACAANPICSEAAIVLVEPGGVRPATSWPLIPFDSENVAALIDVTVRTNRPASFASSDRTDAFSSAAVRAGAITIWTHPIAEQGRVVAVLVMLRTLAGVPTANQDRHLDRLISMAELAFSQASYRRSLEVAATTDALTGLGNRASLDRFGESDASFGAVLFIDLDGFKQVNDDIGHPAGDAVLEIAAQRIVSVVDADDHVVRMGGDEFVVVTGASDPTMTGSIAARIVEALGRTYELERVSISSVTASVGVSSGQTTIGEAIAAADVALLRAKTDGKNRSVTLDVERSRSES